jgi:hypothetical protein
MTNDPQGSEEKVTRTCPECNHVFEVTLSEVEKRTEFTCPLCGVLFDQDPGDFTRILGDLD